MRNGLLCLRLVDIGQRHTLSNMASNDMKKNSPKAFSRGVITSTGKSEPVAPAVNVEQKLKDWESEIDIENLSSGYKIIHHSHMRAVKASISQSHRV